MNYEQMSIITKEHSILTKEYIFYFVLFFTQTTGEEHPEIQVPH